MFYAHANDKIFYLTDNILKNNSHIGKSILAYLPIDFNRLSDIYNSFVKILIRSYSDNYDDLLDVLLLAHEKRIKIVNEKQIWGGLRTKINLKIIGINHYTYMPPVLLPSHDSLRKILVPMLEQYVNHHGSYYIMSYINREVNEIIKTNIHHYINRASVIHRHVLNHEDPARKLYGIVGLNLTELTELCVRNNTKILKKNMRTYIDNWYSLCTRINILFMDTDLLRNAPTGEMVFSFAYSLPPYIATLLHQGNHHQDIINNETNGSKNLALEILRYYIYHAKNNLINNIIMEFDIDINTHDNILLKVAICCRNYEITEYLLKSSSNVDYTFLLKLLTCGDHANIMQLLIDYNADIHMDDDFPLRIHVHRNNINTVKVLLDADANIHADNDYAIRKSVANSNSDLIFQLLMLGAHVNALDDHAFRLSVYTGNIDLTWKLLENHGVDIHANCNWAIQHGVKKSDMEMVKLLLEFGANIDYVTLKNAIISRNLDMIKLLIDHGADMSIIQSRQIDDINVTDLINLLDAHNVSLLQILLLFIKNWANESS
jgi:hypothetical protein